MVARGPELEHGRAIVRELLADHVLAERLQAGLLPREDARPDVVEPVAGRLLELGGREVGRLAALVARAHGGGGVQLREAERLLPQLLDALVARVVLEEPERD